MNPQQGTPQNPPTAYNPYTMGMPASPQPVAMQPAPQPISQPTPQPIAMQQPGPIQQPAPQVTQSAQPLVANPAIAATPIDSTQVAPAAGNQPAVQPNATTASPISNAPTQPANQKKTSSDDPLSTQSTILISELRDGLVIMKDGSFRAVIACQSINFDLMSETEREGVEYAYQSFLNSLNFTTQILIRSQRVDIGPYIERLTEIRKNNDNMLLGVLMDDYINFIDALSQEANIMDKSFFIVVPYYVSKEAEKVLTQTKNIFTSFTKSKQVEITKIDRATYDAAIKEINNRVETVISGLFQIGIHSVRLNTRELGALYYNFNNPDTAVREPLVDFTKLATTYVRKGEKNE